jgi:hypothetical protein
VTHVQLVPVRFDVYCPKCDRRLGLQVDKDQARRFGKAHRKTHREQDLPPIRVHEAKLEVDA